MTTIDYDFNAPADLIEKYGWRQKDFGSGDQPHCLHGAIRECSPVPGDSFLVSEVVTLRGKGVLWNDAEGRTKDEVLSFLRSAAPVTDEELAETFGAQWREIVALVRRAATLTGSEAEQLAAHPIAAVTAWNDAVVASYAVDAAFYAARHAALNAARDVAFYAAFYAARYAARHAAWHAVRDVAWHAANAAWHAALNAACALVVRDRIGTHGFTQTHYDTLTGPWRRVIGPVHPDDAALEGGAR